MKYKYRIFTLFITLLLFGQVLSGCTATSSKMQAVPPERASSTASNGKAMIVFMRPSSFGGLAQSSVFKINNGEPEFIGIISADTKISYQLDPGHYLFMVVGESADFMSADLEENKTYYTLVTPRIGLWKTRFSLKPIHKNKLDTAEFNEWLKACEWVENTSISEAWAKENMSSILSKQKEYYTKWLKKAPSERPKLLQEDGR